MRTVLTYRCVTFDFRLSILSFIALLICALLCDLPRVTMVRTGRTAVGASRVKVGKPGGYQVRGAV